MPANPEEIVGYTATGAEIGSLFGPWGTPIGTGIGFFTGVGKGWYDRHQDKVTRERLERLNAKIALSRNEEIEKAILLQNESASSIINQQLDRNIRATDIQYAQSGAYRTGGRLKAENEMRSNALESLTRVAGSNALAGQQLKQSALALDRDYDLKLAQLEIAKQTGDTGTMSVIAEQLVPLLLKQIQGNGKGVDPEDVSGEGMEDFLYDTTPDTNQPTPLNDLSTNILGVRPYQTPDYKKQWDYNFDSYDLFLK